MLKEGNPLKTPQYKRKIIFAVVYVSLVEVVVAYTMFELLQFLTIIFETFPKYINYV